MKSSLLPVNPGSSSAVPRGAPPSAARVEHGELAAGGAQRVRARAQGGGVKVGGRLMRRG